MARPKGSRDAAYLARRDLLLDAVEERLLAPDGHQAGLRALAEAAGVSVPTLRHYFGSRAGIIEAFFTRRATEGTPYLTRMAETDLPFTASITEATMMIAGATQVPQFRALHDIGLREGLRQEAPGTLYLSHILEPTLAALEKRLARHVENGEMGPTDVRMAALSLVSPLVLASLHQHSLAGAALRPLDLDQLANYLTRQFITAHQARP